MDCRINGHEECAVHGSGGNSVHLGEPVPQSSLRKEPGRAQGGDRLAEGARARAGQVCVGRVEAGGEGEGEGAGAGAGAGLFPRLRGAAWLGTYLVVLVRRDDGDEVILP
eukprot:SAG31_NODE_194_length_20722_cov_19.854192_15_plen_110_part_00